MLIPGLNLGPVLALGFFCFGAVAILCIPYIIIIALRMRGNKSPNAPKIGTATFFALVYPLMTVILVMITEMTIPSNNITSEEAQWGLGQTCALIVALFSVTRIFRQVWNIFHGEGKEENGYKDAVGVLHVGDDPERGLRSASRNYQYSPAIEGTRGVSSEKGDWQNQSLGLRSDDQNHLDQVQGLPPNPDYRSARKLSFGPRRRPGPARSRSSSI